MIDTAETLSCALADFGVDASIDGGPSLLRCMDLEIVRDSFDGNQVRHSGPSTVALASDIASRDIAAGNNGTVLTIDGIDYTVLAMEPDGLGGVLLILQEDN